MRTTILAALAVLAGGAARADAGSFRYGPQLDAPEVEAPKVDADALARDFARAYAAEQAETQAELKKLADAVKALQVPAPPRPTMGCGASCPGVDVCDCPCARALKVARQKPAPRAAAKAPATADEARAQGYYVAVDAHGRAWYGSRADVERQIAAVSRPAYFTNPSYGTFGSGPMLFRGYLGGGGCAGGMCR